MDTKGRRAVKRIRNLVRIYKLVARERIKRGDRVESVRFAMIADALDRAAEIVKEELM